MKERQKALRLFTNNGMCGKKRKIMTTNVTAIWELQVPFSCNTSAARNITVFMLKSFLVYLDERQQQQQHHYRLLVNYYFDLAV